MPEDSWERRYALIFALELHRAECEFLTGDLGAAEERLIDAFSARREHGRTSGCRAPAPELYTTLDQSDRAVEVCLEYLRRIGVDWSPHPTKDEVRQEYERIWRQLDEPMIEDLIELPLMTDPACSGLWMSSRRS